MNNETYTYKMNLIEEWTACQASYIESMLTLCNSIGFSILKIQDTPLNGHNNEIILDEFQNIVVQATALSKYFWNIHNRNEDKEKLFSARAEYLRKVFNLSDDSPLNNRKTRNCIEHFDEHLDLFFQQTVVGIITPNYVGEKPKEPQLNHYFFRAYFTDTDEFQVLDKSTKINPLCDEVRRIVKILEQSKENGFLFSYEDKVLENIEDKQVLIEENKTEKPNE